MSAPPSAVEMGPTYERLVLNGIDTTKPTTSAMSAFRPLGSLEYWTTAFASTRPWRDRQSTSTIAAQGPIQ